MSYRGRIEIYYTHFFMSNLTLFLESAYHFTNNSLTCLILHKMLNLRPILDYNG